jgi:adenylosuccinate lyase
MIERYQTPELAELFSDAGRFATYLEVEILAVEAMEQIGVAPAGSAAICRARAPKIDDAFVAAVADRERTTNHDVAAFVDVVQAAIGGPEASWIHFGLTSSDVVDTAWCSMLSRACALLHEAADALLATLVDLAHRHRNTAMIGRTHGIHAEPTTFGVTCALWGLQVARDRDRIAAAHDAVAVGKLSGAVGTYSNIDPRIEAHVCASLGLRPTPATQVVARDRHAQFLYACAAVGSTCESVAVNLRHLQRTEVREVEEGFGKGQKGSSAMPHKRNPISAETLSGLSRVLRGNLMAGLENVALWHERDISHSSVERIVLPDSAQLAHYSLRRLARLLAGLQVRADQMLVNLDLTRGLVFSQPVLLALVDGGLTRDEAYRIVQEDAARVWAEGRGFRELLEADARVTLGPDALDAAFSLERALQHTGSVFEALDAVAAS